MQNLKVLGREASASCCSRWRRWGANLCGIVRLDDRLLILIDLSKVLSTEDMEAIAAQQNDQQVPTA